MKRFICVDCGWIGTNPEVAPALFYEDEDDAYLQCCPECGNMVEPFQEFGICVVCGCEGTSGDPLCPECQRMMLEVKDASR